MASNDTVDGGFGQYDAPHEPHGEAVPSDEQEVSSDDAPDAEALELSRADEAGIRREVELGLENFEGGMQG